MKDRNQLSKQVSKFALCQLKIQNSNQFLNILLLPDDIEFNLGRVKLNDNTFSCFKKQGLHFHLNINSVLPKIDKLCLIAKKCNAAVNGLTETKLNESIQNGEIEIEGYTLERSDRNRRGGGWHGM